MNRIAQIKAMLASGSEESRAYLAPIIECFADTSRPPEQIAEAIRARLAELDREAREFWLQMADRICE